jgi:hypothetical protein
LAGFILPLVAVNPQRAPEPQPITKAATGIATAASVRGHVHPSMKTSATSSAAHPSKVRCRGEM